jgi:hypothetical protein
MDKEEKSLKLSGPLQSSPGASLASDDPYPHSQAVQKDDYHDPAAPQGSVISMRYYSESRLTVAVQHFFRNSAYWTAC